MGFTSIWLLAWLEFIIGTIELYIKEILQQTVHNIIRDATSTASKMHIASSDMLCIVGLATSFPLLYLKQHGSSIHVVQ